MENIPAQQAKGIFNQAYMAAWREKIPAPSFLKSFFSVQNFVTKYVGIEVQRGTEKIAVDVIRGADGNRNTFSKYSDKRYMPPFFNEFFDATSLDRYDAIFNTPDNVAPTTIGYMASDVAEKYAMLRAKIERAKEKQCSEIFETGIVTMNNGDNIDFKRKATSLVDVSAAPWSTTSTDIESHIIAGCEFIRQTGKNSAAEFNMLMPGQIWVYLKKSNYFTNNANFNQVRLLDINMPQKTSFGAAYQGQISAGAYVINIWTYDEGYEDASTGTFTKYMNSKKVVLVPTTGTRFSLSHAGVPAIIRDTGKAEFGTRIVQQAAEYYLNNYIDPKGKSHIFEIYSAPLAIPVTVDMIYTMQVLV